MSKMIEFMPRPYRSTKVRKAREEEAKKIFEHREAIAKKREDERKEKEERLAVVPPAFSKPGEEISAGISTSDTKDTN